MIWDGDDAIEPAVGERIEYKGQSCVVAKGGAISHVKMCARCVLRNDRVACGNFNCVGTNRVDQTRVYLAGLDV